jgi:hypothetical protein
MAKSNDPVVLELASLPREQMGPFLILGLDKASVRTDVDEHWADRVKWARRNLIKVPLEDINWARETLSDAERRLKADVGSLNADTADALVAALARRYGADGGTVSRQWQPLDSEKPLADYSPAADVPEIATVREGIMLPSLPEESAGGLALLERIASVKLDPWTLELPPAQ